MPKQARSLVVVLAVAMATSCLLRLSQRAPLVPTSAHQFSSLNLDLAKTPPVYCIRNISNLFPEAWTGAGQGSYLRFSTKLIFAIRKQTRSDTSEKGDHICDLALKSQLREDMERLKLS